MTSKLEKTLRVVLAFSLMFGVFALPAFGQDTEKEKVAHDRAVELAKATGGWRPLVAIGAGLATVGGAIGIGRLAASAMEGTARQPEAGGAIRTSMIIAAALIEGFTFFALIVCIMVT